VTEVWLWFYVCVMAVGVVGFLVWSRNPWGSPASST